MKKNFEYLTRLREVMKQHGIDAVVVSNTDPTSRNSPQPTGGAANGSPVSGARTARTALP